MRKWRCVGYNQNYEKNFTIGKIYYGEDDKGIKCDDGFCYDCYSSIDKVMNFLKGYYEFEEVFEKEEDKKMDKFKVGDRVRILDGTPQRNWNSEGSMRKYINTEGIIEGISNYTPKFEVELDLDNDFWWFNEEDLKLVEDNSKTITITTSNTTTTLTDGTHTTSINRYYTDKHDDMVALEEVVNKYKSEIKEINKPTKGKDLIGVYIPEGTKFRVINVEPHKRNGIVCIDEYIGKIGRFDYSSFTFTDGGFKSTAIFEEDYMNAIDKKNGRLCWRYDEVEILWEEK